MKHTKKSLLAALCAAPSVTATVVGPMTCIEEWPALVTELVAQGWTPSKSGGGMETPAATGTVKVIMKSQLRRTRTGTFKANSSRYTFSWLKEDPTGRYMAESSAAVADLKVEGEALVLPMYNGNHIHYTKE